MLMHGRLINPICNKTEITSEFLRGFNKPGRTIAGKRGRSTRSGRSERRAGNDGKSAGGGHGKDNSKLRCPPHGAGHVGRSQRGGSESGEKPVRSLPARTPLHARARPNGTPSTTGPPPR